MTSTVIVALMVLFGAALIGKMLKEAFPGSVSDAFKDTGAESPTPAE